MQHFATGNLGSAGKYLVSFRGVRKSYDNRTMIVKDLNLDVFDGEFLTFLGPSGSGKSTTLMMLAGFEQQSAGSIEVAGRRIDSLPAYKRDIGMVFQNYALFPHLTVAENIAYPLKVRRVDRVERDRLVRSALDMVQMSQFADRKPGSLSGGQQQRIALARALVFGPKLVLMDEPLGALDKQLREHMQYEIKRIHDRVGCTTIYVTHDQSEAMVMSDRIAVFANGRVEQLASPAEIYRNPATDFVASFIGENNIFQATVVKADDGVATVDIGENRHIRVPAAPVTDVGSRIKVSVRPEDVSLAPLDGADQQQNAIQATVKEAFFLGDHARISLAIGEDLELLLKMPAAANIALGDKVKAVWDIASTRAFQS
ncbi:ABC transporter ATP-binding protein [Rhizobium sp. 2MFCol3.1]|uniref:ABC transporter ATP-binding protein n=1 Tax=Rhizobium sp. 2MFCol3.1 TaxID=1246459 RepID=UPI0003642D38|nr:ABC transporter ATP-binding protein [Rhizobium sp. 2MFCol3.1]